MITDTKEILKSKLGSRYRRLTSGKLYFIKDKAGKKISFIPNQNQKRFLQDIHHRNVVLKARQLGFSTLIDLILLDACLFGKNKTAGIIAQDLDNAEKIFEDKIKFVFDNLPDRLRKRYKLKTDKVREIAFLNNGSRISVGNSFRGGTYQYLHISEFGKICSRYPDKAREIMTGALNTVAKDQYVFIESTAEGSSGYFYDICKVAENMQIMQKPLSELDYRFHFYPRHECTDYVLAQDVECDFELKEYFQKLQNKGINLTQTQKNRYAKQTNILHDDIKREFPSFSQEAFDMAIKGSYYESKLAIARQKNRMTKIDYDPALLVNTAWDLGGAGGGDESCIWFFQVYSDEIRLIDYREGSGYSMIEIIKNQIFARDYNYGYHLAPHDIRVHEYTTGKTRFDSAYELGIRFDIVPNISVADGIDKVRDIFECCRFDESRCKKGIDALANYQRERDEKNGNFRDKPLHNRASNGADAFRMLAVGIKTAKVEADYRVLTADYENYL